MVGARSGDTISLGDRMLVTIEDVAVLRRSTYARRVVPEALLKELGTGREEHGGRPGRQGGRNERPGGRSDRHGPRARVHQTAPQGGGQRESRFSSGKKGPKAGGGRGQGGGTAQGGGGNRGSGGGGGGNRGGGGGGGGNRGGGGGNRGGRGSGRKGRR